MGSRLVFARGSDEPPNTLASSTLAQGPDETANTLANSTLARGSDETANTLASEAGVARPLVRDTTVSRLYGGAVYDERRR